MQKQTRRILYSVFPAGMAAFCLVLWLWGLRVGAAAASAEVPGSADIRKPSQASRPAAFEMQPPRGVFINEIHYDNSGADAGEGVEIAGPAGTRLDGWRLVLYNGNGGGPYDHVALSGEIPDQAGGFGCLFSPVEVQNGAPDALALVNPNGAVMQFLSYEGMLLGTSGPARGYLAAELSAEENGSDPVGYSLQLQGTGSNYADFTWGAPAPATSGQPNGAQVFQASGPGPAPLLEIISPAYVSPGERITYTLAAHNLLDTPLHHLTITDAVPAGATFAYALDGGGWEAGRVAWEISLLEGRASAEVRFVAAAPAITPTLLVNDRAGLSAQEWSAPVSGIPAYTTVGPSTPAPFIQGHGFRSPLAGKPAITRGVVTGFLKGNYPGGTFFNGFFIQDNPGDGEPATSDALFINSRSANVSVTAGDLVEARGTVQEFDEYSGEECAGEACLTQLMISGSGSVQILGRGAIQPALLDPPGSPQLASAYFEALEAMQVSLPMTGVVVGPTSFGTVHILPGEAGLARALRGSPQEGRTFGVRHWERSGDINGQNAPGLIPGSVIEHIQGPLAFSYGDYLVVTQAGQAWSVVESQPPPGSAPVWPAAGAGEFSAATLNTYTLDGSGIQFNKVISTVHHMHGPAFLALQEVRTPALITGLLSSLSGLGYDYAAAYSHPDYGGHGVVLLWRTEQVQEAAASTAYQACSPDGSPTSTFDPLWETCRRRGEYPLFARRPVVLTATLALEGGRLQVVVIANHFKSRVEGESAEVRRLEEARFIAGLAGDLVSHGSLHVIVLGDLNDYEDSLPLQELTAGGILTDTWFSVPPENRYSYIYQGISQAVDHILVTPLLNRWLKAVSPLHYNADFPYQPYARDRGTVWRASDHDPVAATFAAWWEYRQFLPQLPGKLR